MIEDHGKMKIQDQRKKLHRYIVCGILVAVIFVMGFLRQPGECAAAGEQSGKRDGDCGCRTAARSG